MTKTLWPEKAPDGSVRVAIRLRASRNKRSALEAVLNEWREQTSRRTDLNESLRRDPYLVPRSDDEFDIVLEGRSGSKLWRDWLVSLSADIDQKEPEVQREGFWDLVSGKPNPASIRRP